MTGDMGLIGDLDPPPRSSSLPTDEESDDDIYGPPVIEASVRSQDIDDDIYGSPVIEIPRLEREHTFHD